MILLFAKRPLMCLALSFVAGMYILSLCDFLNVLTFSLIAILAFGILLIKRVKSALLLLLCAILFLTGCIRYDSVSNIKNRSLYPFINKQVSIRAEVTEGVRTTEKSVSFYARVTSVTCGLNTYDTDEIIRFSRYIEVNDDASEFTNLSLGDVFSVEGKIATPKGAMNSGGFDYAEYLKSENIFFQCNLEDDSFKFEGHNDRPILQLWTNFRKKCIGFFDTAFPNKEGAVLKAFVTGDSSSVSEEVADSFSNSGLSHVLAVSGLHVAVFISLIVSLLKLFKVSKRKEMTISVAAAIFFVLFTGVSVSAVRAGVLAVFALVAKLLYRKSDSLTTLSLAAAFLAAFYHLCIYSASFMLSFSATAGILLFNKTISEFFFKFYKNIDKKTFLYKNLRNLFDSIAVGMSAQIFVIPLLVYFFCGFSAVSVISTMLIAPILPYLLAGGIVFIIFGYISPVLAVLPGCFIYILAKLMILISEYCGKFIFSHVLFGTITPFLLLLYALFITVIISLLKRRKGAYITAIVALSLLCVFGTVNKIVNMDEAQISFLNVGQGDCALFKTSGDCDILIDAGGHEKSESVGEYVIAPYLIRNGVTDIEYIIISHTDKDHIVGLSGLLDELKIDNLIIPYGQIETEYTKALTEKARNKGVNIIYFTAEDKIKISDDIVFTAISPDERTFMYAKNNNDSGIVLRLDYGKSSFLFTGDISADIEKHLIKEKGEKLKADVLKVAHHGSKNSTHKEFLDVVRPDYSFVSVGENNHGHPSYEVMERLKDIRSEVYRADIHKDVTFYFDKEGIKGVSYNN